MLWIEGEDFSARWGNLTDSQIDEILEYAEKVAGHPDTTL